MQRKKNFLYPIYFVLTFFIASHTYADINAASAKVKWGYIGNIGPSRWSQLNPSFALCVTGKAQSPIDIPKKINNVTNELSIQYESEPLVIVDDGTTDLMIGKTETIINDGHGVQLNFPAGKETIVFAGKNYHLVQLHFHTPSENTWHGRNFPLEIHFVHQGEDGKLLVIGVFGKPGSGNSQIEKIIANLPKEHGKEFVIKGESINPTGLLPINRDYYRFDGSLTTPPCTEGVQWIVMSDPISVSSAEVMELRRAAGGSNARPIQPLHGRKISFSATK